MIILATVGATVTLIAAMFAFVDGRKMEGVLFLCLCLFNIATIARMM